MRFRGRSHIVNHHHNNATSGSFSSLVPREYWVLLIASGRVPMFARIVCCFAAVLQRVQKWCTICDIQPTTSGQLEWRGETRLARARTAREETNGTVLLRLRVRHSNAFAEPLPPPMDGALRGPRAPHELPLEHRQGHVPGGRNFVLVLLLLSSLIEYRIIYKLSHCQCTVDILNITNITMDNWSNAPKHHMSSDVSSYQKFSNIPVQVA